MPICEICSENLASDSEMKTHLLLSHLENEMGCPFCSLSGVSYDELHFHINTAHAEMSNKPSSRDSMTLRYSESTTETRAETRTETPGEQRVKTVRNRTMVNPVTGSDTTDTPRGSPCGTDTHSPDSVGSSSTHSKNTKERQGSVEDHVASKQKRLSSPFKGTWLACDAWWLLHHSAKVSWLINLIMICLFLYREAVPLSHVLPCVP